MRKAAADGKTYAFVPNMMETVNGGDEDETELAGKLIEISVFLGVFKGPPSSKATVSALSGRFHSRKQMLIFLI
jgi:hypothetical protein